MIQEAESRYLDGRDEVLEQLPLLVHLHRLNQKILLLVIGVLAVQVQVQQAVVEVEVEVVAFAQHLQAHESL